MVFKVREIQENDIDGFRLALDSVVRERRYLLTVKPPSYEATAGFVRNNIAKNHSQFVALVDDDIVGWADIVPYQNELTRHAGLLGMGVVSTHRGKGIGKELLTQTLDHARKTGLKRVELEVFANNAVAISLYKQLGFEHEGTKIKARYINECYEDVCFMGLWY